MEIAMFSCMPLVQNSQFAIGWSRKRWILQNINMFFYKYVGILIKTFLKKIHSVMLICAHLVVMLLPLLLFANGLIPNYFFVNKQTLVRPSFGGQTESENG
jgi:hypothetical protein